MAHPPARPPASALRNLLTHEASGGLILMASAAIALIVANSPASEFYAAALARKVAGLSVLHWINDALMVLFFVLVGLEIKRELLDGHLARWEHRILPGIAAAGGMVAPALWCRCRSDIGCRRHCPAACPASGRGCPRTS